MKTRKSLILILALALLLSVFILPGQLVHAQTVYVNGPNSATIGTPLTVTIGISPAVQIANGFDVNVNYDAAGLQYNGHTAHISTMSPSVSPGNGLIILGYQGGNATAGNVFSLSFTPTAAGTYRITVGGATYGLGEAAGGASLGIQVAAAAAPPPDAPTPTPLATVGPTPMPTVTPGPTVPPVTLPEQTEGPTEAQVTEAETGEPVTTFYTFDGKALVASDQVIPEDRYTFDYAREEITVSETTVQVLRADGRPRLFWLETVDGEAGFYLHWQLEDRYVPYRLISPLGDSFVILPPPSDAALPEGFEETDLEIDGTMYPAFKAISERYRSIMADQNERESAESLDLPEIYVVFARVQRQVIPVEEEQAGEETVVGELATETDPDADEVTETTDERTDVAEEESWEQGEYYFYDQERSMLFPLSLMLTQLPEITPSPTPQPTPAPTPIPTAPPPIETIPVEAGPVINLFGYEYDVWKAIIFVLGFLLLLTWLILLIRSLGRKSREVERAKFEKARMMEGRERTFRTPDKANKPAGHEKPIHFDERPSGPDPALIIPPALPLEFDREDKMEDKSADLVDPLESAKERPDKLPDMPTLKTPRPEPLPTIRNAKRTHADEMVLRPLPTEAEGKPKEDTPLIKEDEETKPKSALPQAPVIRRIEVQSRKPKIRKPERPPIDGQDNSEI